MHPCTHAELLLLALVGVSRPTSDGYTATMRWLHRHLPRGPLLPTHRSSFFARRPPLSSPTTSSPTPPPSPSPHPPHRRFVAPAGRSQASARLPAAQLTPFPCAALASPPSSSGLLCCQPASRLLSSAPRPPLHGLCRHGVCPAAANFCNARARLLQERHNLTAPASQMCVSARAHVTHPGACAWSAQAA